MDLKASTRRKWRLSGRTLPPKHTEALSSNNSTEHSAVKVLLCQQFGFFRLSYSGKVYFVAVPGKRGVSQAVQPGQPTFLSFLVKNSLNCENIVIPQTMYPTESRSASCVHIHRLCTYYDSVLILARHFPGWQLYCCMNIRSLSLLRFVMLDLLLLVHSRTSNSLSVKP